MTEQDNTIPLTLALSPAGHLYLDTGLNAQEFLPLTIAKKIQSLFEESSFTGLLHLGIRNFAATLPPSFLFWQKLARQLVTEACKQYETSKYQNTITVPSLQEKQELISQAPFMIGSEYLNTDVLETIWNALSEHLAFELRKSQTTLQDYLNQYNPSWNQVGRICFHLAENKNDDQLPFAFLATYTSHLIHGTKVQHLPLKRALEEYAGEKNKSALLALLIPMQKAAEQSSFIKELTDCGDIFQPLAWSAKEAYQFLKDIPLFESAGVIVRVPNWWNPKKPSRPQVSVTIGKEKTSALGLDALMDFNMHVALANGEKLSENEWKKILSSTDKFVKIKGQWVEIDNEKLQDVLSHWKNIQNQVKNNGLTFAEGMRLLAGITTSQENNVKTADVAEWSFVTAGDWLEEVLNTLRNPENSDANNVSKLLKKHLHATLRPYQLAGVQWLWLLYCLKLGGCLADDMGLGKTIQILSLLLLIKHASASSKQRLNIPSLLIVPASLLGNWQTEIARFTPDLKIWIAHSSINNTNISSEQLNSFDLVITTYGFIHRSPWLNDIQWNVLILDEAQTIKNPTTKQTRAVKALKSKVRFTLTGTPIENRLTDLWSLFDFTSPGLLGSSKTLSDYGKNLAPKNSEQTDKKNDAHFFTAIRKLVSPYILRRLKSDKRIIEDLPDKTELQAFCTLSKQQVSLYNQALTELSHQLENTEGIQRRGLVLSYLIRFKQICNHPAQWLGLGHEQYDRDASGKFSRLQEICEEIAAKQEKVLVFTQFREIIPALSQLLSNVFGREGLILQGDTSIKKRPQLVEAFQQELGPPFFVLSLKAGGTGLNLTNASHVIHFDRWWNPAVENQATDRAYRIGQKKNVLVHKFICRGTIEEKIDALITAKKTLSQEILTADSEISLTELSNDELMKIVSLDIHQAMAEC